MRGPVPALPEATYSPSQVPSLYILQNKYNYIFIINARGWYKTRAGYLCRGSYYFVRKLSICDRRRISSRLMLPVSHAPVPKQIAASGNFHQKASGTICKT